jgi:hypothetical protein
MRWMAPWLASSRVTAEKMVATLSAVSTKAWQVLQVRHNSALKRTSPVVSAPHTTISPSPIAA